MHLLIPFACTGAPACAQALGSLQLPFLEKLLRRLVLVDSDTGSAESLSPPHERALAAVQGMAAPDGCIAWAALEAAQGGHDAGSNAWAWITPVHWDVGADHITMADPDRLDLQEAESRELLSAAAPFFEEDGMALHYATAQRWLARGKIFDGLASASLDRVAGREISAWMPTEASLRRLQNEMQMLLYTHAVNDARNARSLASVNSFWVSGTGQLPPDALPNHAAATGDERSRSLDTNRPIVAGTLRDPALAGDWPAWTEHWRHLDQHECKALLESLASGNDAQLTLCGERSALRFATAPDGMLSRLRRRFKHTTLQSLQDLL